MHLSGSLWDCGYVSVYVSVYICLFFSRCPLACLSCMLVFLFLFFLLLFFIYLFVLLSLSLCKCKHVLYTAASVIDFTLSSGDGVIFPKLSSKISQRNEDRCKAKTKEVSVSLELSDADQMVAGPRPVVRQHLN